MKDRKWFKALYVNQIELAITLFPRLSLTCEELMVVIAILFLQKNDEIISVATISRQTKLTKERINEILAVLTNKEYLIIRTRNNKIEFNLDGLFQEENEKITDLDNNLFTLFEQEFGRVLTQNEIQMLVFLKDNYSQEQIENALRKALNNEVRSINYVAKILSKSEKKDDDEQ